MSASFPIESVRAQFPSLTRMYKGRPAVYFDGPAGSQVVKSAIDAISDYMTKGGANRHGVFPSSVETEEHIAVSKEAIAELFNAKAVEIAFGPNATSLMFQVSRALANTWKAGDEIVLTELDHHANVDSWRLAAEDKGVLVKYIPLDTKTLTLDLSGLDKIITDKTRLVAIGAASNCVGTMVDMEPIIKAAKAVGAIVAVDAVHAIPHFHLDMKELGADMIFASVYKFFGPHIGFAIIKEDLFESLSIYKVAPAPGEVPDRLEMGTQAHEMIPAVKCCIDFIASLGEGSTKLERIKSGYDNIEAHEGTLAGIIREELPKIPGITVFQAGPDVKKTPTISFIAEGFTPVEFCRRMCEEHSIFIADGHFYASTLADRLGLLETGSFIRAGLAPYNTMEEVHRFLDGVKAIMSK